MIGTVPIRMSHIANVMSLFDHEFLVKMTQKIKDTWFSSEWQINENAFDSVQCSYLRKAFAQLGFISEKKKNVEMNNLNTFFRGF